MLEQKGRWFGDMDACIECGTTKVKHHGFGLCENCYARKHRKDNLERARTHGREYESRPEIKMKRKIQNQTERRKASVNKSAAKYRRTNKDICNERTRRWREENPDKITDYYKNVGIYVRIVKNYGEDALRKMVDCNFTCHKCGSTHRVAVHHIDWNPENNIYGNFAILCGKCHSKVHAWVPKRLRNEIFNEWLSLQLEETDGELRVRNIRFPEKNNALKNPPRVVE